MIQTNNLSYQYSGSKPIEFPDLKVERGQPLLLCGESGCGKTTLLHLLAGLRRPTTGNIIVDDNNISNFSSYEMDKFRGQHIGIVYQKPYFIESLSVLDNLLVSPYSATKDKANAVTERLNIGNVTFRYPHQLSTGQQQRATIARAVMNEPKLILADEPTSALDNKNCTQVLELLLEEASANDAALIIVTHDDRLRSEISNIIDLIPIAN